MTTATRQRLPRMSADQAKSFTTASVGNAIAIKGHFHCGCEPYEDVFTMRRWNAQGFSVKKGEKGLRLPVVKQTTRENEEGEQKESRILGYYWAFCKHQVHPFGTKEVEAPVAMPPPAPQDRPTAPIQPRLEPQPQPAAQPAPVAQGNTLYAASIMHSWKELSR